MPGRIARQWHAGIVVASGYAEKEHGVLRPKVSWILHVTDQSQRCFPISEFEKAGGISTNLFVIWLAREVLQPDVTDCVEAVWIGKTISPEIHRRSVRALTPELGIWLMLGHPG